ncbi:siderophore-interacting protein [Archangium violaceum]|uniref:FAD-binding protein n=1 Tax=Archangium violaceum Cb vi76 TaxID=1406225 RepID=A0A084SV95_9BACT|nr:siderophore-interacting protein [Archangium violaceum]KFA92380.1 FAD-binding protein [Archangium violaceum Cb vi76]
MNTAERTSERTSRRGPFPIKVRLLEVLRTRRLSPDMVRVTLGGPELEGFRSEGADDHVRLFFAAPGERKPVLPTGMGPRGLEFPPDKPRPPLRDYTPRRYDAAAGELDIDFVIHGTGPGSTWASQARPGDLLGLAGPRGSLLVTYDFDAYVLFGDETALPALTRRLEELPEGARALVFAEVANAEARVPVSTRANLELHWLHRDGAPPGTASLLEPAIRGLSLPPGDVYVWGAGESTLMRTLRLHLLNERGLRKEWVNLTGYWKRGVEDHDHDEE